jgi:hypothetical protein
VHCCVVSRLCYINFLCSREIYLLLIECKISICEWDIQSVICHFHRCPHNNEAAVFVESSQNEHIEKSNLPLPLDLFVGQSRVYPIEEYFSYFLYSAPASFN